MKNGRITENVLKRSVLRQIGTRRDEIISGAGIGNEGVFISGTEGSICAVCCMQEGFLERGIAPILQKGVNRLAARGAEPIAASISLLLPAEEREENLRALIAEAEDFCRTLGMQIAEAGGRVSGAAAGPYGTVAVYGTLRPAGAGPLSAETSAEIECHTVKSAKPGQEIVVSKWIALEGTAILAERHRKSLLERYPAWLVDEAEGFDRYLSTTAEASAAIRAGACAVHNVSEGGIFAALWELAEGSGTGLSVDLKKLPLKQETVEICNYCNVNPYELLSEGALLITCRDGEGMVSALESAGIPAAAVGQITDGRDRLIRNEDEVRYLDRPHADAIYSDKSAEEE